MTEDELQTLVQNISLKYFHLPFRHLAKFNSRLRTTGGRYLLGSHNLEFNELQLRHFGMDAFVGIIKHELCHYHLHLSGSGFRHRDPDFRKLLQSVGGSRYCGTIPGTMNLSGLRYHYRCTKCGLPIIRKRRLDTRRYVCAKCGGRIRLIKKERREQNKK
ncbi:SprT family protein [Sporolactobacillus shoreae]|uniref:Protein SprT-like n=1 Tax=Sporolactobacillus shoreae TaxID=1465501 RepID=A0A4Z0GNW2_9BACL|nr:SprT family protein [Sporolactobacillus shoreae]TGA97876.1 SprT family protein [Sporolactobacillus shoreae]